MRNLVSIIIPVYNTSSYLKDCLDSVRQQSYQNLEVIIIDDGSNDGSEEILRQYAESDSRFRVFNQENHGLGYTRNRGISLSNGEFLFFLDSDDTLPYNAIELLVSRILNENDIDYAVGKVVRFNNERKYMPVRHLEFNLYKEEKITTITKNPELLQDSIACNKLWRKEFFVTHNFKFIEGKYYEDLLLTLKAAVLARKISVTNKIVYNWRVRNDNKGSSITQQQMKLQNTIDRINALKEIQQWLKEIDAPTNVINESNLKSLIDIIRLHGIKYSLVEESQKNEWQEEVLSFLQCIPIHIAQMLPEKERRIYDLIMNRNFTDLKSLSMAYTNTETIPLVEQINNEYFVRGEKSIYTITKELKPTITVLNVKREHDSLIFTGKLSLPKASKNMTGVIIFKGRRRKVQQEIGRVSHEVVNEGGIYPFEHQKFKWIINYSEINNIGIEETLDFYFRVKNNEQPSARIRVFPSVELPIKFKIGEFYYNIFRTQYGNLSIEICRASIFKNILKKIKAILKNNKSYI